MANKKDKGHEETDKVLSDLEKRISKEYAQAEKEISDKLNDYLRRFETKDKIKAQAVQDGKITQKEYEQWRVGQIAVGERWKEMRDTIADDLTTTAQKAKSITDGYMPEVYAINHNYGTFQVEKAAHIDTSYTLYDRQSVERLFKGDSEIYHKHGIKVGKAIAEGKQKAWDKKQVESCMIQSLLQGESIGNIATRLAKTVGDSDRKACIRNARTMTTGVENAGRVDSYQRAEDMGIDLEQEWMATLDDRTRHEHRMLDGQRVKVGEKFQIDGYELAYPADPMGEPEMVYNCRCTLIPAIKGFDLDKSSRTMEKSVEDDYDKWKESHYSYSDPITKQDDIAETMKDSYIADYKYLAGQDPNIPNDPNYTPPTDENNIDTNKAGEYNEPKPESEDEKYLTDCYNELDKQDVEYNDVEPLTEDRTMDEIISDVGGGDKTGGSCVSVGFAFVGQMCGYDVGDFRGGDSMEFFSSKKTVRNILNMPSLTTITETARSELTAGKKVLKQAEEGKLYYFCAGKHASIVRKVENGYEFLELQNEESGWNKFDGNIGYTLANRFGCSRTGNNYDAFMTDIDSFKGSEGFRKLLGYINTNESEQKKGVGGYAK